MTNETTNVAQLQQEIEKKQQDIENYKGVLERYGHGRWYNLGRRNLEEKEEELKKLQAQLPDTNPFEPQARVVDLMFLV